MPVAIVSVTNHNDFPIEDGLNGVRYTFAPGKPVTIPVAAARHIFGWSPCDPYRVCLEHVTERFGWNFTREGRAKARQWANGFVVKPLLVRTVEFAFQTPAERTRELSRLRVQRFRARQKERRAAAEDV
jgi:hypothetical protein